jgi:endoribonuclease LACTB2
MAEASLVAPLDDLPLGPRHPRASASAAIEQAHAEGHASLTDPTLAMTWATPELAVFPVLTPTLPPATHTNVVFVVSGSDAVLIEPATPYEDELARLAAAIAELARRGATVRQVWATHHHPDHVGGASQICARLGLPLRAHPATFVRLPPGIATGEPIHDGDRLHVGDVTMTAQHVPGHAAGHLTFFDERRRALIAGDMVAAVGTILIEPSEGDMGQYLRSLERLAALDAHVVIPAHGGAIRPGREVFERYVAHRLLRERRVLDALQAVPRSLDVLLEHAYADTPRAIWPIARLSLEAHLLKLLAEGRALREGERWALG